MWGSLYLKREYKTRLWIECSICMYKLDMDQGYELSLTDLLFGDRLPKKWQVQVLNWTICAEHYADNLEVDLEEIMMSDFNAELEDESPRFVSKELVTLHNDLIRGDLNRIELLRQSAPQGAASSHQQMVSLITQSGHFYWLSLNQLTWTKLDFFAPPCWNRNSYLVKCLSTESFATLHN